MTKKIFIITGEYSGDLHASKVASELFALDNSLIIEGVGESNLQNAGVKLFIDHSKMGKMGLTFKTIIDHISLGKKIIDYLKNEFKPDLVLLVDYGAFNLQISKALKKAKIKNFYFIPPQIWASRKYRLKTIKKNIDKVLTIFPFEKEFYDEAKINSDFVGHPIISEIPVLNDKEAFFKKHNLDINKKLIGIFPGSRIFEIKYLLKVFLGAIKIIEKHCPNVQFAFSKANSLSNGAFDVPYKTIKNENYELLAYSDALLLASGTVALEASMYETPMVIAYKGPIFFYLIYLLVRNIKKACLVNIITNDDYVDEYLMFDATSNKIAKGIINILNDENKRAHIIEGCKKVKAALGKYDCAKRAAKIIYDEINNKGEIND